MNAHVDSHPYGAVPVTTEARAAGPVRRGPNAEALRQHRETVERRRRMAEAAAKRPAPAAPHVEPTDRQPAIARDDALGSAERWRRKLAQAHPVHRVILVTAQRFGVEPSDVAGPRRTKDVVRPRQVAMYLARVLTSGSFPDIGRRFGGRDHTTVQHAVRKIGRLLAVDPEFAALVADLRASIEEHAS